MGDLKKKTRFQGADLKSSACRCLILDFTPNVSSCDGQSLLLTWLETRLWMYPWGRKTHTGCNCQCHTGQDPRMNKKRGKKQIEPHNSSSTCWLHTQCDQQLFASADTTRAIGLPHLPCHDGLYPQPGNHSSLKVAFLSIFPQQQRST